MCISCFVLLIMYSERSIWRHQPRTSVPVAAAKRWATTAWRANPAPNGCLKPFPAWIVVVKEPLGKRPAGWTVWPCQVSDFFSSSPACEPTYLPILAHSHVKLLVDTVGHGFLQMKLAILTAQLDPKYSWHLMKTKKNAIIYTHKPSKILKGKDDFRLTFGRPMMTSDSWTCLMSIKQDQSVTNHFWGVIMPGATACSRW